MSKEEIKDTAKEEIEYTAKFESDGIFNWNGSLKGWPSDSAGKKVNNHKVPPINDFKTKYKDDGEYSCVEDIDFLNGVLASDVSITHQLYYPYLDDQGEPRSGEDCKAFLLHPLLFCRGYVFAEKPYKRKQAIQLPDLSETTGNKGYFKQGTRAGDKDNTSMHSQTTAKDLEWKSTGSINHEEISFITLSAGGGRQATEIRDASEGIEMAETITENLKKLADKFDKGTLRPEAIFSENWVRSTIAIQNPKSKAGIQINPDGQYLIALNWFAEFSKLKFKQSKRTIKVVGIEDENGKNIIEILKPDDFFVYNEIKEG